MTLIRKIKNKRPDLKIAAVNESSENRPNYDNHKLNEKCVAIYVIAEKNKYDSNDLVFNEYNTKIILFGYLVVYELKEFTF